MIADVTGFVVWGLLYIAISALVFSCMKWVYDELTKPFIPRGFRESVNSMMKRVLK